MLSFDITHRLTDLLIAIESSTHFYGRVLPALTAVIVTPHHDDASWLDAEPVPVPDHAWHTHPGGTTAVLTILATALRCPAGTQLLARAPRPARRVDPGLRAVLPVPGLGRAGALRRRGRHRPAAVPGQPRRMARPGIAEHPRRPRGARPADPGRARGPPGRHPVTPPRTRERSRVGRQCHVAYGPADTPVSSVHAIRIPCRGTHCAHRAPRQRGHTWACGFPDQGCDPHERENPCHPTIPPNSGSR